MRKIDKISISYSSASFITGFQQSFSGTFCAKDSRATTFSYTSPAEIAFWTTAIEEGQDLLESTVSQATESLGLVLAEDAPDAVA